MAGHSKWANIKHRKEAQDKKRSKVWTKLIREITVAAREGGGDAGRQPPAASGDRQGPRRQHAEGHDRARHQARQRGTDTESYEEIRYEGYGPGGVAVMVDCMTDNRNRTASEVRHAFTKHGGNLGTDGSVGYLFSKRGILSYEPGADEDRIMEAALEGGADDVVTNEDRSIDVFTAPDDFDAVRAAMERAGLVPASAEVTFHAATAAPVEGEAAERLLKMLDVLEDLDDVQDVYTNADIDADAAAAFGG